MTALSISTGPYKSQGDGDKKKKRKKQKKKTPGVKEGLKMGFVIVGAQHAREVRGSPLAAYGANISSITVDCNRNRNLSCPCSGRRRIRTTFNIFSAQSFCRSCISSSLTPFMCISRTFTLFLYQIQMVTPTHGKPIATGTRIDKS